MADPSGRITLWGIEVFVAIAEETSITAAARRLGASASAVSQQLTNLETALGTALLNLDRTGDAQIVMDRVFRDDSTQPILRPAAD